MEKQLTEDLLDILNMPLSSKGYAYWVEAVQQQLKNPSIDMTKIYRNIARKYSTHTPAVERAMRRMLSLNYKHIKNYFNVSYKITNKVLLKLLIREIQRISEWGE